MDCCVGLLSELSLHLLPVVLVLFGSAQLAMGSVGGFWAVADGILLCIVSGLADAWVLLVEIFGNSTGSEPCSLLLAL